MLAERISAFSCEKIESVTHGEWLTLLNTDVQLPFSQPLHFPHAVNAIIRIIVSSAILWHMNPVIFDYVMLFVIPHILMSQFFVARVMPKLNKKSLEATAVHTANLDALITCADIAALYDSRAFLIEKFKRGSLDLLKAKMKMRGKNALNEAIIPLFGMGGYLTVLLAGSSWIAGGRLTFGDLTAAFQYRGGVLIGSMMLINSLVSIQASVAGVKRINAVMDDPA
jgi:ABC-type bacteriocin/lantibiotic exporter with double-glycine peptidase domain